MTRSHRNVLFLWFALVSCTAFDLAAQATEFGVGCALGGGSPPAIALDRAPAAGRDVRLLGDTRGGATFAVIGSSRDVWAGRKLPLSLAPWGLGGCELAVAADVVVDMRMVGGRAALDLPLSRAPAGFELYAQVVALRPDGRVAGFSRGLEVRVAGPAFRLVVVPDTQHYVEKGKPQNVPHLTAQMQWIRQNAGVLSFVTHVGDIVQNGWNLDEWKRAVAAMDLIHGKVPYGTVIGNHDYHALSNRTNAQNYLKHFGPQRYQKFSWFRGASPDGRNTYQVVSGGGVRYLHLGLQWLADDRDLLWAQGVLARNPELPTIVTTHQYLGNGDPGPRTVRGRTRTGTGTNSGHDLYHKLVEPFPQVFLVVCGHIHGAGGRRSGKTALGRTVHEVLTDFQEDRPYGGNGFFRVLEFDRTGRRIAVRTLSQTFVPGRTAGPDRSKGPLGRFDLAFDFAAHERFLRGVRVLRFRQGQDFGGGVYRKTRDTYVGDGTTGRTSASKSYGGAIDLRCDGDGDHEQALLAFDGLVGKGAGQVPPGARVVRAILTLTTEGASWATTATGARLYRMRRAWSESSTWKSLGNGVQIGTETESRPDLEIASVGERGTRSFDVTTSVQAWANGANNHGWLLAAKSWDMWSVRSSEWGGVVERPMLTVILAR